MGGSCHVKFSAQPRTGSSHQCQDDDDDVDTDEDVDIAKLESLLDATSKKSEKHDLDKLEGLLDQVRRLPLESFIPHCLTLCAIGFHQVCPLCVSFTIAAGIVAKISLTVSPGLHVHVVLLSSSPYP